MLAVGKIGAIAVDCLCCDGFTHRKLPGSDVLLLNVSTYCAKEACLKAEYYSSSICLTIIRVHLVNWTSLFRTTIHN